MNKSSSSVVMSDPPFADALFNNTKFAWIWLIVRLYAGYEWISAGLEKLQSPAWMQNGSALKGYWTSAVAVPAAPARPAITYSWYRSFLEFLLAHQSYVWFGKVVSIGEFLVGVALVLGIFVGISAFFGGLMNFNYMLAGSASTNPVLFILAILLMLAWKTAGYWGLDHFVLRWLGTPWKPGNLFQKKPEVKTS
jgi:thiosulfate dehydrogenase (quinone) large subunit